MTVGLCMLVKDEAEKIATTLQSALPVVDHWSIIDTGSTDGTPDLIQDLLDEIPGQLHRRDWVAYGQNRTEMLDLARDTADWLLMIDADMTIDAHPDLKSWLATDPDPTCDGWNVEILDNGLSYRLPLLLRGRLDWRYAGVVHEHLDNPDRHLRPLLGLTVTHHGQHRRNGQLDRDLELLRPGYDARNPRDVFYYAQTLRDLGRTNEAIDAYRIRADLGGWDEEAWYADYQAATLAQDVPALLAAHRARPWRHEPLTAAADIVASRGTQGDMLFIQQKGAA